MALLSNETVLRDESLDDWVSVGCGGFGYVYKARHKEWGFDVAIKLFRDDISPCLSKGKAVGEEATHMEKASCEFVLRVYGIYQGYPPGRGAFMQKGIVMEFMSRGAVQSLQKDLCGPPPWPLAFRLAHQVALAMNFLHSRNLMHHDLKPSNVLLNDELNAKLADFGLCRVSTSAPIGNKAMTGEIGGSYKYMPPEAFEASYEPVRAFDRYSYGVLLWSIVTGQEPYPVADYSLVALRIPRGDRPPIEGIDQMKVEGLKEVVDLMKRCWDERPSERPSFKECLEVTERVLKKHNRRIYDAVHQVLTRLESPTNNQHSNMAVGFDFPLQPPEQSKSYDTQSHVTCENNGRPSKKNVVDTYAEKMNDIEKAKFIDDKKLVLIQRISEVMAIADELGDMIHSETYSSLVAKHTSQDKMRVLYRKTFCSGGVKVKAAFYNALRKHHPELVEMLDG